MKRTWWVPKVRMGGVTKGLYYLMVPFFNDHMVKIIWSFGSPLVKGPIFSHSYFKNSSIVNDRVVIWRVCSVTIVEDPWWTNIQCRNYKSKRLTIIIRFLLFHETPIVHISCWIESYIYYNNMNRITPLMYVMIIIDDSCFNSKIITLWR